MRLATMSDIDAILVLVAEAKEIMKQDNHNQWDISYPVKKDFIQDITDKTLYVLDESDIIKGFIVINNLSPEWYNQFEWPVSRDHALVIHRLVASAKYPGVARKLIDFAENYAKSHQFNVLLTDTFSENQRAQARFKKHHFIKVGEMLSETFPFDKGKPFYAYYKKIN
ncbi:GNAT family N-acetyltransferase [Staphylococcus americanisciuri]|uniref:GNAT family N-acetyltransferase n=1 Tax=Staphylococcus americanisciuri TaxID=2973940 RepID=A0ABT2EYV5_9STAP|nr:GNAT family N-acetyltransferase [Staphylococcus americanisciuri]MCS4485420.1 GNAT family N-acetyltransferase [Staphylococcus americanisciuri]